MKAEERAASLFADGFITIAKIQAALEQHEAETRADERKKTLKEALDCLGGCEPPDQTAGLDEAAARLEDLLAGDRA